MATQQGASSREHQPALPTEAREYVEQALAVFGEPLLDGRFSGRFCYVTYEGRPLCRLGYRGELTTWDFAIDKYSSQRYSTQELFPATGTVEERVSLALSVYDLR